MYVLANIVLVYTHLHVCTFSASCTLTGQVVKHEQAARKIAVLSATQKTRNGSFKQHLTLWTCDVLINKDKVTLLNDRWDLWYTLCIISTAEPLSTTVTETAVHHSGENTLKINVCTRDYGKCALYRCIFYWCTLYRADTQYTEWCIVYQVVFSKRGSIVWRIQ